MKKCFLFMMLSTMLISCGNSSDSHSENISSDSPQYYYGTWESDNKIISITFFEDGYAECTYTLGGYPIDVTTRWEVSKETGVVFGTRIEGEYAIMTADGHLYHYIPSRNRITDDEVILTRK